MTGKTHLLGGALAAMLLAPNSIEGSSLILLGSLISDIDHPKSTIGKYVPLIPRLLPHRGLTHSMIFCVLCYLLNPFLSYGVGVHIMLDMMTTSGVKLFYPLPNNIRFPLAKYVKTNGIFEVLLEFLLIIVIFYIAYEKYIAKNLFF